MQEKHLEKPWLERLESPESSKLFQARPLEGKGPEGQGRAGSKAGRGRAEAGQGSREGQQAGNQSRKNSPITKQKKTPNPPKLRCRAGQNRAGQQGGRVGGRGRRAGIGARAQRGKGRQGAKEKTRPKPAKTAHPNPTHLL